MSVAEILDTAARQNVELWFEGQRLRYRAPSGALPPDLRAALTQDREAILAELRLRAAQTVNEYPLSYGQQSLWFLNQTDPESAAYHVAWTGRIRSEVNVEALRWAFQALVDRHAVLRTTYPAQHGVPAQQVTGYVPVDFSCVPAAGWTDDEMRRHIREDYLRPFDLERGPLLRIRLFQMVSRDAVVLVNVHHIAVDGWSLWILLDELRALYAANTSGGPANLPRPEAEYADFVRWQHDRLAEAGETLWEFWKRQLVGELPVLSLPADHPRPNGSTGHGASHNFALNETLTRGLKALAKAENTTLYMTLLAAFQVLLHRYSGQADIIVGSPTFGRSKAEFARVVGDFINMIPLRAACSGEPTFREFLARIRQTVLAALEHQDYPFPQLVARLGGHREASRSPVFQATFDVQRVQSFGELAKLLVSSDTTAQIDFGGLTLQPYPMPQQEGQFDLGLLMVEMDETLPGTLKYDSELFDASTIARLQTHFQTLLESIVAHPEQRLAVLPVLTEAERHQILVEWNQTHTDYPRDLCLHQLFEAQVARTPNATAVIYEDQTLTYAQLNARANQLAHHLRTLGVKPNTLMGICMERSIEMVVAIYAVLKAGGAYVPIDPGYPPERQALMMTDTQAPILLTQAHLKDNLPETTAQIICIDLDAARFANGSEANLPSVTEPGHVAYVIYTSGSTGKPKGAMIHHAAIVNHMQWMLETFPLTPEDRVFQKTPFSFDASVWEFHAPLLAGAQLVMAQPGGHQDGFYMVQTIVEKRITVLQLVPSLLQLLLETPGFENCHSLRRVYCGGEALSMSLVRRFCAGHSAQLYNLYGPTETAIDTVYWHCDLSYSGETALIGRPAANTQVYILDQHLQPVPIGVSGELHIGGTQVGLGYYQRPELTQARFVPDPFSAETNARLYKTGDVARYRPDGMIEYLGRSDSQIKLRGFRIELGEIEAVLEQHPAIQQAIVIVREDAPGDQRLTAYLRPTSGASPTSRELRHFLRDQLPAYMVPAQYVLLDVFPLTPNGKIDRRALPASAQTGGQETARAVQPPTTPTEQRLAAIWQKALNVPALSVYDNFFDLGGHSLLAMQVIAQIQEQTGQRLNPARLRFESLGQLAATLEAQIKTASPSP